MNNSLNFSITSMALEPYA